jgi:AraC-like DNA-binding protein
VDKHSQRLITDAIGLLLDYCMRYYDRQFITRHKVNSDIMSAFEHQLTEYFRSGEAERKGLPTVAYFADKAFLSAGYFGDLVKKETGMTAQRYIQNKVVNLSKQYVMDRELSLNQIAYKLGFQYPQHFTRLFKKEVGMTPSEYRN